MANEGQRTLTVGRLGEGGWGTACVWAPAAARVASLQPGRDHVHAGDIAGEHQQLAGGGMGAAASGSAA